MRDFNQELRTLKAERKRVDGIAHSSDAIALARFKRGECFAENIRSSIASLWRPS